MKITRINFFGIRVGRFLRISALVCLAGLFGLPSKGDTVPGAEFFDRYRTLPNGARVKKSDALAVVDIGKQKMYVIVAGRVYQYVISSGSAGEGFLSGSGKTPIGWHKVHSRYGKNAQIGQLFKARRPVKGAVRTEKEWRSPNGDEVLTRIFWLEGLEPKVNRDPKGNYDSFRRCIYIHGTNQEHLLGRKASHGCIRMGNREVAALFEIVQGVKNFYVFIK
jgi:lipoprotein-anchoring transpeptidase ErfK/SrfK